MDEAYISEIRPWPVSWAPEYWMFCDGSLLPISSFTALFSLIGTTYGGDGKQTFALPDLRGRIPVGVYQGNTGSRTGQATMTLDVNHLPQHHHNQLCKNGPGDQQSPVNGYCADEGNDVYMLYSNVSNGNMGATTVAGGGQPFDLHQPSLGLNYIICVNGMYPPRS